MRSTMLVDSVMMGHRRALFVQQERSLKVALGRTYHTSESLEVTVHYHNAYEGNKFGDLVFSEDSGGNPWIWSAGEPYGARYWWPCKDHPAYKADSADIIVTVARGLRVASNGELVSTVEHQDSTITYHWHERYPIATYLVSIAIGRYASFADWFRYSPTDSMEILNYFFPADSAAAHDTLRYCITGLSIFTKLFGPYPFLREKYGHAQVGGGIENQTMTSISITNLNEANTIHELAHQWFGNMITCRSWSDLWLSEGFATYAEALYFEIRYGKSAYWDFMKTRMNSALGAEGSLHVSDTLSMTALFDPAMAYRKGATVLHMLRHVLGDSTFFRAIYNYATDPLLRYGVASTEDFQRICEQASRKSLEYFFKEWVYGERYPDYGLTWSSTQVGFDRYQTEIHLVQTSRTVNPPSFTMPLDVKFSTAVWDTSITVKNDARDQHFRVILSHEPTNVVLDPDDWVLKSEGHSH